MRSAIARRSTVRYCPSCNRSVKRDVHGEKSARWQRAAEATGDAGKVKTPGLPLHLAGETQRRDLSWHITTESDGMIAKGMSGEGQLRAFVVSEDRMKEAFALLKTLFV